MKVPAWLTGLLLALAVAVLWWTSSGDSGGGGGDRAGPWEGPDHPSVPAAVSGPSGVDTRPWDGIDACEDAVLPAELVPVLEDIATDGPYDYPDRDGSRFHNNEGFLPDEDLGYYREFTVETPGLHHRGARRIVTGGWQDPEVWYYTEDHYESFCEFAP